MAKHAFDKFVQKEPTGAKKKELIKQEKRKVKKEARVAGEEFRRKKKEERFGSQASTKSPKIADRGEKTESREKKKLKRFEEKKPSSPAGIRPRSTAPRDGKKIARHPKQHNSLPQNINAESPRHTMDSVEHIEPTKERTFTPKPAKTGYTANKRASFKAKSEDAEKKPTEGKRIITRPAKKEVETWQPREGTLPTPQGKRSIARKKVLPGKELEKEDFTPKAFSRQPKATGDKTTGDLMPLNKYIAHAGVCGRREAADLVKHGKVAVNGSIIYEPGFKVTAEDKVVVKDKQVFLQHNPVYILLNKPKDYLTTAKDPEGRKTVFDIVANATTERVFPVGRLDRNTTGVLLLTNDGELAQKLTHPSYEIKKIYEVKLDRDLTKKDFEAVVAGVTLEDGFVAADSLAYADANDKSVVGIEIHSGRNRIVRRIFEHLGYDVKGLDRVMFANLTKKNVDRGKYRFLSEKEVRLLKFMNQSFVRKGKGGDEGEE